MIGLKENKSGRSTVRFIFKTTAFLWAFSLSCHAGFAQSQVDKLDIPDPLITEAYERAATQKIQVTVNGHPAKFNIKEGWIGIALPPASGEKPCRFEIKQL